MEGPPKIENKQKFFDRTKPEARSQILYEIENRTENINTERVLGFIKDLGLPPTEFRLISYEDIDLIKKILNEKYLGGHGIYHKITDIAFVTREPELEKVNGPELIEGFLVHELAHGGTEYVVNAKNKKTEEKDIFEKFINFLKRKRGGQETICRIGFRSKYGRHGDYSKMAGNYLEEGFAEMIRGEYMKKYSGDILKNAISARLKIKPERLYENRAALEITADKIYIPTELLILAEDGTGDTLPPSIAGAGIMELCEKIPGLRDALIEARKNPKALTEIPKIVNAFDEGLYPFLMKLQYDVEDFIKGTKRIQDKIKKEK